MKFDRTNGYVEFDIENRKVVDAAYRGFTGKVIFIEDGKVTEPYTDRELSSYEAEAIDLSYTFCEDVNVIFNFDDGMTIIEDKDGNEIVLINNETDNVTILNVEEFKNVYIGLSVAFHNIIESAIKNGFNDYSLYIENKSKKVRAEEGGLFHVENEKYEASCDEDGHIKDWKKLPGLRMEDVMKIVKGL